MAKVAATEEQVFQVLASPEEAYAFFSSPERLCQMTAGVVHFDLLPEDRVHWMLEERADKGIRFQPDYVVAYQRHGAGHVSCRFVQGNMRNDWDVWITPGPDGGSQIRYRESVEPDLPITPLLAALIKPLVARELRNDINLFLNKVRRGLATERQPVTN